MSSGCEGGNPFKKPLGGKGPDIASNVAEQKSAVLVEGGCTYPVLLDIEARRSKSLSRGVKSKID